MELLISIITVSYNSESTIAETIQSVLSQSYTNIEYIIVDGASQDDTLNIIKSYQSAFAARNIRYKFYSEPDRGIYEAMNKGIAKCTGELIGIINSDDWYENDAVEKVVSVFNQHKDHDIFHGLLRFIDKNGSIDSVVGHHSSFLDTGMIEHPTCFIKAKCYTAIGYYDEKYKSAADYEWMQRARNEGLKFLFSSHIISNFRRGGMSESRTGDIEELTIKRDYGIISPFKWFYWCLFLKVRHWIN